MEHLEGIHYERFYRELINSATLINEIIEGETEGGDVETYYNFDDAEDEASYDGATLSEYGNAFYFKEGKIYECVIYFENMECTGVNLYSEPNEIKAFVKDLLDLQDGDEESLLYDQPWVKEYLSTESKEEVLLSKTIESILNDLDKYGFSQFGDILHYMINDVGPETTGKAIVQMAEVDMHYNLFTCMSHLYDKWGKDDEYFEKMFNLTDDFIETYIKDYYNRLPNLKKHIAKKADQNFGDSSDALSIKNGFTSYLVMDPKDWKNIKGPIGLAIHLCGCENFNQIIETEAQKEFKKHFINIFFFTLKEIENLPSFYKENIKNMLVTSIESLYHDDELDWGLEKEEGILTYSLGALLDLEYGLDFNAYITEDEVPIAYSGAELALFGVNGIDSIEYPIDYNQMATDLLAIIYKRKNNVD